MRRTSAVPTSPGPPAVDGTGNLIVGYDESNGESKTGSHNIIVGRPHAYTSYGGLAELLERRGRGSAEVRPQV